jgi:cellulose synthase operon protein B
VRNILLCSTFSLAVLVSAVAVKADGPSLVPEPLAQTTTRTDARSVKTDMLVPFSQSKPDMRLIGEDDTRHLTFFLSPEQALSGGRLRLAYTNAVSILPDGAMMSATVNGHAIGDIPIRSPQTVLATELPLAPGTLVAGWNTVRLRAQQQHRVDCSIGAAYELWTQVDPVTSGFLAETASDASDLASLITVGRTAQDETEIRVITAPGELARDAGRSLEAVQTLALLLGRQDLRIAFAETEGNGPGIDLFVGDALTPALSPAARQVLSNSPNGLSARQMGDGRVRVVLRGANDQALSSALVSALNGPLQPVLASRRALTKQPVIDASSSRRVNLAEAGYETAPFAGRLFRASFDLVMPEDFYPGDYGSIDLKLNGATAPGLAPGAQVLVRVNERAVTSHVLYDPEGVTLKEKALALSLRAFHPGVNKVEILAELPTEADQACDPTARSNAPRFLLLEETGLVIPELARVGRMPDLASLVARAYPFNHDKALDLVVDAATPGRLSTAVTILSRLALASGHPLPGHLVIGSPDPSLATNALVITAGRRDLAMTNVPPAKGSRPAAGRIDGLTTASVVSASGTSPAASASDSQALMDAFQVQTAMDTDRMSWTSRLSSGIQHLADMVDRWLQYQDVTEAPRSIRPADALVTLGQDSRADGAIWTVITAQDEADLLRGAGVLLDPVHWGTLKGGKATVLRSDLSIVTETPAAFTFYPLTDLSLGNLRRLAAAWLSDHFVIYVGLVLLFIGSFGLWLGYIVPRKGVRTVE